MAYNYKGGYKDDFEIIPEGTYEFFIESISERESKKGRPMVEIVLKPSKVELQNYGKIWHYIMLDTEFTESNVGRLLASMGKDPENAGLLEFSAFKGEYLECEIKHRDDENYGKKAVVYKMISAKPKRVNAAIQREQDRLREDDSHPFTSNDETYSSKSEKFNDDDIPF